MRNIFTTIFMALAFIFVFNTVANAQITYDEPNPTEYYFIQEGSLGVWKRILDTDTTYTLYMSVENRFDRDGGANFVIGKTKEEAMHTLTQLYDTLANNNQTLRMTDVNGHRISIIKTHICVLTEKMKNSPKYNKYAEYVFICKDFPGYVERKTSYLSVFSTRSYTSISAHNYFGKITHKEFTELIKKFTDDKFKQSK